MYVFRDIANKGDIGPDISQSTIKRHFSYKWGTLENGLGIRWHHEIIVNFLRYDNGTAT